MKGHLYRITVEHLEDPKGVAVQRDPLVFETRNHDDLFEIIERIKSKNLFDEQQATAFAVGLKLFSEVMLANREHELFKPLQAHFGAFMKGLKKA